MQSYNAPQPGLAGAGGPPPAKKGFSKGCLIGIIVAVVLAVGLVVVAGAGVLGFYFMRRSNDGGNFDISSIGNSRSNSSSTYGSGAGSGDSGDVQGPQPTQAQRDAISGGQTASWEEQEMSWTVPQTWNEYSSDSQMLHWRSPGTWDAANLIVNISEMSSDFPTEISIKAYYDSALSDKRNGKYDEVRWLKLGGVKGVMFRESSPEIADNPQRMQWLGYRNYKGQTQMLNVMLSTRGKDFARHEDALYGILYSTEF
jgi:hypothetical protein